MQSMTRRACWQTVTSACKALLLQSPSSFGMIQSPILPPLTFVPGVNRLLSTSIRQPASASRCSPVVLAAKRSKSASEPPSKPKVRQFSEAPSVSKNPEPATSQQPEHTQISQQAVPEQTPQPTETTPKISRRATRRTRDALPKQAAYTDLREVHGVGPKNEQLLLKVGLSNVASLKDRYKNEHKESTGELKQYLQVWQALPCAYCSSYKSAVLAPVSCSSHQPSHSTHGQTLHRVLITAGDSWYTQPPLQ